MSRISSAERRHALLEFGRSHFAECGFDACSMDEIAKRAGVSKALLYHYFGGRRAFYMATVSDVVDGLITATTPPDGLEGLPVVLAMATGFVRYSGENAAICRAITRGGLGSDAEVNAQLDRLRDSTVSRVLTALGRKDPGSVAQLVLPGLVGFIESVTLEWLDGSPLSETDVVAIIVRGFQSLFGLILEDTHAV